MVKNAKLSDLSSLMLWAILSIIGSGKMKPTLGLRMLLHQQSLTFSMFKENPMIYDVPQQTLELRAQSDLKGTQGIDRMMQFYHNFPVLSRFFLGRNAQPADTSNDMSYANVTMPKNVTGSSSEVVLQEYQRNESGHIQGEEGHHINHRQLAIYIFLPAIIGGLVLSIFIGWMCYYFSLLQNFKAQIGSWHFSDPEPNLSIANANGGLSLGLRQRPTNAGSIPKQGIACKLDYATLEAATQGFSSASLLGEGGFGSVYKAKLSNGCYAAVKKLFSEGLQAKEDFQAEIELMERVRHPNLLSFIGFSSHEEQHLLVYELMENGSLYDHLQGPLQGSGLTWNLRLKIALDAAKGLEHLHDHCNPPVIHRDFKSSNILLDQNFSAKLSDFGLALSMLGDMQKGESLQLQGTFGYIAPEYILTGVLTEKSDVYAYGVVLLELITGRRPIDNSMPTGCHSLVTWATPYLTDRNKLPTIVAPVLEQTVNLKQLYQLAAIAVLCVQPEPGYRPLIGDVVNSLVPLVSVELGGTARLVNNPSLVVQGQ
ncbi:hypothetical protein O6H91_13G069200 [Diphasiastrum complanatum]|uniref:Uncharacterized protein n=2 Tax=Diphasiastrum complanatum TaxID=34168 RepID=A0ACC2BVS6_DIPCM|nr:hypothetical protein O6H91_13G069200 [Diphasiastrum complanatum]KAJ7533883.1 hypothetical protein O6H91_13G069200 [Diphasiastrum complanatum]